MPYANVSRPNGFLPAGNSLGHAQVRSRPVPNTRTASAGGNVSTDIAIGDAYAIDANGNAYRAGPSDVVRGIVIGFDFAAVSSIMNANGPVSVNYITGAPAAGASFPNIIGVEDGTEYFECQANNAVAITALYGLYNLLDAAPDSKFVISQQVLNFAGGAGSQFKLIDVKPSPEDNSGSSANARVIVQLAQAIL